MRQTRLRTSGIDCSDFLAVSIMHSLMDHRKYNYKYNSMQCIEH